MLAASRLDIPGRGPRHSGMMVDNPQEVDPRTLVSICRFKEAHGFVAGLRILNFSRVSPNFMRLTSLGIKIGILCDFLYSVLLFNAFWGYIY